MSPPENRDCLGVSRALRVGAELLAQLFQSSSECEEVFVELRSLYYKFVLQIVEHKSSSECEQVFVELKSL